jgi:hypothetical protein
VAESAINDGREFDAGKPPAEATVGIAVTKSCSPSHPLGEKSCPAGYASLIM